MKLFQEILSKIELVDIYQTIDNEFQVHAIYFAMRPTVFPKPILCEVKPKKDSLEPINYLGRIWRGVQPSTYLFFDDFLPESLDILLIILSSAMNDCKFDLGQIIFFCILLKSFIKCVRRIFIGVYLIKMSQIIQIIIELLVLDLFVSQRFLNQLLNCPNFNFFLNLTMQLLFSRRW